MVKSLTSNHYTEFLDTLILSKEELISHPVISDGQDDFTGEVMNYATPYAHPGLIALDNINSETGLPMVVHGPDKYGDENLWRFWAPDEYPAVVVRSYIFLLLQPSLDLKINVQESHNNLGFRLSYSAD